MGWSHIGLRNVPRRSWVAFPGRYLETQERLQTVPRHCIQYMTLSTECVDLFLLGCIPGASQAVPGSLPGWNNPNNPSWERLETFLSPIKQCLDDVWRSSVKLPGRNNFVTRNVPGIPIPYQDGPKWNVTWERLGTFLGPTCDQPIMGTVQGNIRLILHR